MPYIYHENLGCLQAAISNQAPYCISISPIYSKDSARHLSFLLDYGKSCCYNTIVLIMDSMPIGGIVSV
ncbi:MAG TPA: hypothetical protein DEB10_06950 [Ruminococcaceae bacterium]|nr:hypothetical protein [Oscillospiraceae bacterium]